jgi:hypothetical protein
MTPSQPTSAAESASRVSEYDLNYPVDEAQRTCSSLCWTLLLLSMLFISMLYERTIARDPVRGAGSRVSGGDWALLRDSRIFNLTALVRKWRSQSAFDPRDEQRACIHCETRKFGIACIVRDNIRLP